MVLESFGQSVTEMELRELCECDDDGTQPKMAVACARHFGCDASEAFLDLPKLKEELESGIFPIAYLDLRSPFGRTRHTVVVTEISETVAQVLDPDSILGGERQLDVEDFNRDWQATNGQTILIRR